MPTYIDGEDGILYIHDGTAYRPIACISSNGISSQLEVKEKINKSVPGAIQKTAGAFSYSLNVEGDLIDTTSVGGDTASASYDYLFNKQTAKELVTWKMTFGTIAAKYGTAYITELSAEQPADDTMTFSATLDGSGNITGVDPEGV